MSTETLTGLPVEVDAQLKAIADRYNKGMLTMHETYYLSSQVLGEICPICEMGWSTEHVPAPVSLDPNHVDSYYVPGE